METVYKHGFFTNDLTFYEDGSSEQGELLNQPITDEERGTLLGCIKQIYQSNTTE